MSCQRCDKTICTSCMHQASVGFHCPSCVKSSPQRVVKGQAAFGGSQPVVTIALIAINVLIFFFEGANGNIALETVTRAIGAGEWWRLITGGFLHGSMFHVGMNMYVLWALGPRFERGLGRTDFLITYVGSLLAGSLGVVVMSSNAEGASGAIFGLFGAMVVLSRSRGISLSDSGLLPLLLINGVISFLPGISLGGHLGGFLGGCAFGAIWYFSNKQLPQALHRTAAALALCAVLFGAGILLA